MQADASTDSGNAENELFLVLYFDPQSADGRVHVKSCHSNIGYWLHTVEIMHRYICVWANL